MSHEYDTVAPPNAKRMKTDAQLVEKKILYVVLEGCSLETAKVGGEYVILSSDKHANFLRKQKKDPADYRPDILHQCLLNLLDSPLNRAGKLRVFFRTTKNVLVDVSPQCRIPRTFDRFCGLMGKIKTLIFSCASAFSSSTAPQTFDSCSRNDSKTDVSR